MAMWGASLSARRSKLKEATSAAQRSLGEWLVRGSSDLTASAILSIMRQVNSQDLLRSFTQLIDAQDDVIPSPEQLLAWRSDWPWSAEYFAALDNLIRQWITVSESWKKDKKKKVEPGVLETKLYSRYAITLATYAQALHYKRTAVRSRSSACRAAHVEPQIERSAETVYTADGFLRQSGAQAFWQATFSLHQFRSG